MQERIMRRSVPWYLAPWVCALALIAAHPRPSFANAIYVTTMEDKVNDVSLGDRGCSLKEAIFSSKFKNHVAIQSFLPFSKTITTLVLVPVSTSCAIGSGDDTIYLPSGAVLNLSKITDDVGQFCRSNRHADDLFQNHDSGQWCNPGLVRRRPCASICRRKRWFADNSRCIHKRLLD